MGFYFTKSVKAISLSMVKSMDFKQIKARLINHLKKQMKKEETKEFSKLYNLPKRSGCFIKFEKQKEKRIVKSRKKLIGSFSTRTYKVHG